MCVNIKISAQVCYTGLLYIRKVTLTGSVHCNRSVESVHICQYHYKTSDFSRSISRNEWLETLWISALHCVADHCSSWTTMDKHNRIDSMIIRMCTEK